MSKSKYNKLLYINYIISLEYMNYHNLLKIKYKKRSSTQ